MREETIVKGMVIAVSNVSDYDRRLVIMTLELGKITVFARAARKPNNPNMAVCQPFTFGSFKLYEGRSAYNLIEAKIDNYFMELRKDLDTVAYGLYFCELLDYFVKEGMEDRELLKLLYRTLTELTHDRMDQRLIRCIYEIRLLTIEGLMPAPDEGVDGVGSEAAAYAIGFICNNPIEKIFSFVLEADALEELVIFCRKNLGKYIEHKLKTEECLP